MDNNFYKQLIEESPSGYAYQKIICDENDISCDCEFIEVNAAFEKLTGLKRSEVVGEKITKVFPAIVKSEFPWIDFFGDIAINCGKKEMEQFFEALQR